MREGSSVAYVGRQGGPGGLGGSGGGASSSSGGAIYAKALSVSGLSFTADGVSAGAFGSPGPGGGGGQGGDSAGGREVGKWGPTTPGPAPSSRLGEPYAIAVNARGDLFIADGRNSADGFPNDVVEEVSPAGELSVVAGIVGKSGPPTPGPATRSHVGDPVALAFDAHGDLFVVDEDFDGPMGCEALSVGKGSSSQLRATQLTTSTGAVG